RPPEPRTWSSKTKLVVAKHGLQGRPTFVPILLQPVLAALVAPARSMLSSTNFAPPGPHPARNAMPDAAHDCDKTAQFVWHPSPATPTPTANPSMPTLRRQHPTQQRCPKTARKATPTAKSCHPLARPPRPP